MYLAVLNSEYLFIKINCNIIIYEINVSSCIYEASVNEVITVKRGNKKHAKY